MAEKQFVEIIRVISARTVKIVIMDEPTSSLTKDEIDKLFAIINELKRRKITVIYISHRLDEVVKIADRVTVFRDGKNRGTLEKGQFDEEKIITLMLGHSLKKERKAAIQRQEVIYEVRNLSIPRKIQGFEMILYRGEILGIAGLMGSGKDELVKCLFGLWPALSKELYYKGKRMSDPQSPGRPEEQDRLPARGAQDRLPVSRVERPLQHLADLPVQRVQQVLPQPQGGGQGRGQLHRLAEHQDRWRG